MAQPDNAGAADPQRAQGAADAAAGRGAHGAPGGRRKQRHARGAWQLLAGGALVIASPFLLVPGLNEALLERYVEGGGTLTHGVVLVAFAAALLLPGTALLLVGFCLRHAVHRGRTGVADGSVRDAGVYTPASGAVDAQSVRRSRRTEAADVHPGGHAVYPQTSRGQGIQTGV